ncbi:hypothetical protein QCD71_04620 [Sphingomonas sp. PsM26]|nr:hypothetical protein [Sphingomonas sp. PsM26]
MIHLFGFLEQIGQDFPAFAERPAGAVPLAARQEVSMPTSDPTPSLSEREWLEVAAALRKANACGCAAPLPGERVGWMTRLRHALSGAAGEVDPRLEAIRRFACGSYRRQAPAEALVDDLTRQGFSLAQIDAIALLSA